MRDFITFFLAPIVAGVAAVAILMFAVTGCTPACETAVVYDLNHYGSHISGFVCPRT